MNLKSNQETACTLLVGYDGSNVNSTDLKMALEKGDTNARAEALETMIRLHVNGEPQNHMIMSVIKYITPLEDHLIKKLVLYFWEVVEKTDRNGKLLSEMILICSFLREDLLHPNEYVRGLTLRFLCKVKEKELVEPLISSVVQNLSHRVTYVRRSAVLAVHAICRRFPDLLPDAPELVEKFIGDENDVSARRNAFDMLVECAPERAVRFLTMFRETTDMAEAGAAFQVSVVDFARQMIRANPYDKAKYVAILFNILQSKNPAVRFQCASTLLNLSSSPTAIRQAALTFIDLLKTHSDNSVRLIVIDKLDGMRARFSEVLQDSLLDVVSALANGSTEIRKRIVALAVELVSSKNVELFIQAMKKELLRSQSEGDLVDQTSMQEYKRLLIRAIRTSVIRQPHMASSVLPIMMDYTCDSSNGGYEVISFIREILQMQPSLRASTLKQLMEVFPMITSPQVVRSALWLFGTHVYSVDEVLGVLELLQKSLKPFPLTPPVSNTLSTGGDSNTPPAPVMQAVTTVREDGTYVTSYTAVPATSVTTESMNEMGESSNGLRLLITKGNYFVATALASTLSKLIVRLFNHFNDAVDLTVKERARDDALMLLQEIIRYGTAPDTVHVIDEDSHEHICLGIMSITNPKSSILTSFVDESHKALSTVESTVAGGAVGESGTSEASKAKESVTLCNIDMPVIFTQLKQGKDAFLELEAADDLGHAIANDSIDKTEEFLKRLEKTIPLSGFCDPVYCEATVTVHQFDVSVDWYLVNRTPHLLQDLTIELTSLGGMKLCERPQVHNLPPHGTLKQRTALKVSSTETGVIYANILYDAPNGERCCVILNDIHVDIMDYIRPASCLTTEFREKWGTFDWENTIAVNTDKTDLRDYVEFVMRETNMQLLEPYPDVEAETSESGELQGLSPLSNDDDYDCVSCSLYARTVFGEDALANVSLERDAHSKITGVVRIRSNTQSIAYGIGERLSLIDKGGRQ
ncbi:putative coatomer beta subunit [Trypanosoma theileri]|uniref:Coatomer subunit beta n=1 Tax=Trypanosoma theileri TaxID=67003 RepID=A0A1X0NW64_9TRYP|nr:putative coatomer beta subunit [Trypanosoma theileri]ORC88944.1 putative coatomer beta subunit [Trypanosoma theileri]